MGLDMFAYTCPATAIGDAEVDIKFPEGTEVNSNFAYWRKFNHLHGWMERLYHNKGGESSDFNCNTLRLTLEDLDALENSIKANDLPHTTGFFFGGEEIYPEDLESLEDFIVRSREAIAGGLAVIYDSWW